MVSGWSASVRHAVVVLTLVLAILCGWSAALPLSETIITTGSVQPDFSSTDTLWTINEDLIIGFNAEGTLSVTAGSDVVANGPVFVGNYDDAYSGATGTLVVTGAGSTFSASESGLFIGPLLQGTLTLTNQATLSSHDTIIGGSPLVDESDQVTGVLEGIGYATVSGGASWDTADGWLTVGAGGQGELAITGSGSAVTTDTTEIGLAPGSTGDVLVDQSGSWTVTQDLVVGVWGEGSLTISGGGQVESLRGWVGGVDKYTMDYNEPIFDGLGDPNGTGTVVVTGTGSQWTVTNTLVVGDWGVGTVRIEEGAQVTAGEVFIGGVSLPLPEGVDFSWDLIPDGSGAVTVTGAGSLLEVTASDTLYVGYSGTGVLDVNDGGQVVSDGIVVGGAPGATGTITVHDAGSQLVSNDELMIGAWGDGNVIVSEGATAQVTNLQLGGFEVGDSGMDPAILEAFGDPNGTGTLLVTGTGSTVDVNEVAYVGYSGIGIVDVNNGATVDTSQTALGLGPGSYGEIVVDGAGSSWNVSIDPNFDDSTGLYSGVMVVGGYGEGLLTAGNGGDIAIGDVLFIGGYPTEELGYDPNAIGYEPNGVGDVVVTGSGSTLTVNGIHVGGHGEGTLSILDGGTVTTEVGIVSVASDGTGDVLVDGAGSLWQNTASIAVGAYGEGALTVSNGGQASIGQVLYIGGYDPNEFEFSPVYDGDPNGTGTVTVTDANSLVEAFAISVGSTGDGTLEILNGATVESQVGGVGVGVGSVGLVTVDGTGSTWRISGTEPLPGMWTLQGEGDLIVSNGGLVEVQDPCAILAVADAITVGSYGEGTLTIRNGAAVFSDVAILGGTNPAYESLVDYLDPNANLGTGTGTATVSGDDSTWETNDMYVGFSGTGSLTISSDGGVLDETGWIGVMPGAVGTVVITDANWVNTDSLVVGAYGQGELTIAGGGYVTAPEVFIGGTSFDSLGAEYDPNLVPEGTGYVTVAGSGSELAVSSSATLYVGYSGAGTLDVADGGLVTAGGAIFGAAPNAGALVTVDNAAMAIDSDLVVGAWGEAELTISNGGEVTAGSLIIGGFDVNDAPEGFAEVLGDPAGVGLVAVTGEGSRLEVSQPLTLYVGYSGAGQLDVFDGGTLVSQNSYIGMTSGSLGLVDVNDGTWDNDGDLTIGNEGSGALFVENGGLVSTGGSVFLGSGAGGEGVAVVMGEGSQWAVDGSVYVGGDAEGGVGEGLLAVSDGAELWILNELTIWETGTLIGDGTIIVDAPTTLHNYGTIAPADYDSEIGTLTVNGDVVFHDGSTYAVDINNTSSDKLVVDGGVTIDSATVQLDSEGTILGEHEYEILTADTIVGEFNDLDTALLTFSFSEAVLDYNETAIYLHITAANFNDPNIVQTCNQAAVGGALQTIGDQGGNAVTDAVQDIATPAELRAVYDQLSGQTRPSLAPMTVAGSSKFLSMVSSRVQTVRSGMVSGAFDYSPIAAAGPDQVAGGSPAETAAARGQTFAVGNGSQALSEARWGLWGRGYGLFGDRDSGGGVPGYGYDVYGGSFGVDYQFTQNFLAGIVGGMSEGDVDFDSSRDNTDFDAAHIGLYGSFAHGSWSVDSVITYAGLDYETERFVDALDERLTGNFDGSEFAAYVEASRNFDLNPKLRLAPLASLQYTYVNLDSYTETGGASALTFDEQTYDSFRGSLGARLTQRLLESSGDFCADLQLRARWAHEFGDDQASVDSSFASDPTVVFTVEDQEVSRDSAILGTGLSAQVGKKTRAYLDYDARLNSDESVQVLSAALQYRW
ncbi:MAG: autotransporter domain-containing protein [Solirubrobacterales bacterium]